MFFLCAWYPGSVFGVKKTEQICPTRDWEWKQEPTQSIIITVCTCETYANEWSQHPLPTTTPQFGFGCSISLRLISTLQKNRPKASFPRLVRVVSVQPRSLQPLWNYCIILIAPRKTFLFGSTQTDLFKISLNWPCQTQSSPGSQSHGVRMRAFQLWAKGTRGGKERSKMEKDGGILFQQILMLIWPNGAALLCFFRQLIACAQSKWIFQTELNQSAVFWN